MTEDQLNKIRLTLVISRGEARPRSLEELATAAARGGAGAVQLREKNMPDRHFYEEALEMKDICRRLGLLLIINDRVDIALAVGADGLHLGQNDLPAAAAAALMPKSMILGVTAPSVAAAEEAARAGADYLGVGALFPTGSKDDASVIKAETARAIIALDLPTVGIGGISLENAAEAWAFGFNGLAVISALAASKNPEAAAAELLSARV